jgi:hypothetical protein
MAELLITHPTVGTTAPVQWTVGTNAGEWAAYCIEREARLRGIEIKEAANG